MNESPKRLVSTNPKALVADFVKDIEGRAEYLREDVRKQYLPSDIHLLPKKVIKVMEEWCNQVPVLGFNSGKYDLNLIKNHFISEMTDHNKTLRVGKKVNQTMFLTTSGLRFLDIINYLSPGTSYEKWIKAYGCNQTKSWFDSPDKLNFPGLPEYTEWYSKQKADYLLTE